MEKEPFLCWCQPMACTSCAVNTSVCTSEAAQKRVHFLWPKWSCADPGTSRALCLHFVYIHFYSTKIIESVSVPINR